MMMVMYFARRGRPAIDYADCMNCETNSHGKRKARSCDVRGQGDSETREAGLISTISQTEAKQ